MRGRGGYKGNIQVEATVCVESTGLVYCVESREGQLYGGHRTAFPKGTAAGWWVGLDSRV